MADTLNDILANAIEDSRRKAAAEKVYILTEKYNLTKDEALDILGISGDERAYYENPPACSDLPGRHCRKPPEGSVKEFLSEVVAHIMIKAFAPYEEAARAIEKAAIENCLSDILDPEFFETRAEDVASAITESLHVRSFSDIAWDEIDEISGGVYVCPPPDDTPYIRVREACDCSILLGRPLTEEEMDIFIIRDPDGNPVMMNDKEAQDKEHLPFDEAAMLDLLRKAYSSS